MRKPVPVAPPGPPGSLAAALAAVPDPRHPFGWRPDRPPLPLVGVLHLAVAAMLCGCRSLYAGAQWGRERIAEDPDALTILGLPPGRSPSHPALHRLFAAVDAPAFERALGQWLQARGVARLATTCWLSRKVDEPVRGTRVTRSQSPLSATPRRDMGASADLGRTPGGRAWYHGSHPLPSGTTPPFINFAEEPGCRGEA